MLATVYWQVVVGLDKLLAAQNHQYFVAAGNEAVDHYYP
jgi:hypothetical protein